MTCSIEECTRPAEKRGWCATHYRRWQRHGDPMVTLRVRAAGPPEERWMHHVVVQSPGCWIWTGARTPTGYGTYSYRAGTSSPSHRFVYQVLVRPLDSSEHLDHLCRNRACVNPDHLEPVSQAENNRRSGAPPANNSRKTHCPQGHPYSGENLRVTPAGARTCRECQREHLRQSYARRKETGKVLLKGHASARRTHCPQGHPYDDANTYVAPSGWRQCRTCRDGRMKKKAETA